MLETDELLQAAQKQAEHTEISRRYEEYLDDINDAQADVYELTLALFPSEDGALNPESEAFFTTPSNVLSGLTPDRLMGIGATHIVANYMSDILTGQIDLQ